MAAVHSSAASLLVEERLYVIGDLGCVITNGKYSTPSRVVDLTAITEQPVSSIVFRGTGSSASR